MARRSHGVLNERHDNAVGSQQQRSDSVVRSPRAPRGHRVHAAGTHMIATRTPLYAMGFVRRPHGVYGDVTATLPCPHGASTAFALRLPEYHWFHCALTETTKSCHGDHCAYMALPRSPSTFAKRRHSGHSALWTNIYKRECHTVFYEIVALIGNFQHW